MVLGIQVAGLLFGLFMVYYSFINYKKMEFTINELVFWILFWAAFIIVSLFPEILNPIVKTFNFARTFDLLVITGFILLTWMIFYTYTVVRKTQRKVEVIVRKVAIKEGKKR